MHSLLLRKEDLFKFELLIWGNRMKAARLKAMMRKTPAPFRERVDQGHGIPSWLV